MGLALHSEMNTGFSFPLPHPSIFYLHSLTSPTCSTAPSGRGGREEPGAHPAPRVLLTASTRGHAGGSGTMGLPLSLAVSKHCSQPPSEIINYGDFCHHDQVHGEAQPIRPGALKLPSTAVERLKQNPNRARCIYQAQGVSAQPSLQCYGLCVKSAELQTVGFLDGKELRRAELPSICQGRKSPACGTHSLGCDPTPTPQRPYLRGPRAWHRANTDGWRQWMFSEGMNE